MSALQNIILRGLAADRPAAGIAGRLYYATDTGACTRDTGSAWQPYDLLGLILAKGDLLAGTGSGAVAVKTVGADGLPLVADSGQSTGYRHGGIVGGTAFAPSGLTGSTATSRYVGATVSGAPASGAHLLGDFVIDQAGKIWICTTAGTPGTWTDIAGGGGGSGGLVDLGAVSVPSGVAASLDLTTIAAGHGTLIVEWMGATDGVTGHNDRPSGQFNGDTGGHYDHQSEGNEGANGQGDVGIVLGVVPNANAASGSWGMGRLIIPFYDRTDCPKGVIFQSGSVEPGVGQFNITGAGYWENTAAITEIALVSIYDEAANWVAGSRAQLWGTK
jgi:hypothetical protein